MSRPATGEDSRRYERYQAQGLDVAQGHDEPEPEKKANPKKPPTQAEQARARDKRNNLNMGLPLHRGAEQATHDAVVAGLHGRNRSEAEIEAEAKRRHYEGTNSGTPIEHVGVSKKDRDARRKAAADELEVE
jgi:hypothetical protein